VIFIEGRDIFIGHIIIREFDASSKHIHVEQHNKHAKKVEYTAPHKQLGCVVDVKAIWVNMELLLMIVNMMVNRIAHPTDSCIRRIVRTKSCVLLKL
jgi:hypothetical protein